MTSALQICKAALEEIGEEVFDDAVCEPGVVRLRKVARAALEAAAKVGGLADDQEVIARCEHAVCPNGGACGYSCKANVRKVLATIDAYQRGAR